MSAEPENFAPAEEFKKLFATDPASETTPRESLVAVPGLLVAVDPATIQAGLTAASIIVSVFGAVDNHKHHRKIEKLLRGIQAELGAVNRKLDLIISALQALGVYIDSAFARDAWLTLQARAQMVFANYLDWADDGKDGQRAASAVLRDLEVDIGKLVGYGYAHYHRVGFAMAVAAHVAGVAGRDRPYWKRVTEPWIAYFQACLAADRAGSIQYQLDVVETTINDIEKRHERYPGSEHRLGGYWRQAVGDASKTFIETWVRISGSLAEGYASESFTKLGERVWPEREHRGPRNVVLVFDSRAEQPEHPVATTADNPVQRFNAERDVWLNALGERGLLRMAVNTCHELCDQAVTMGERI